MQNDVQIFCTTRNVKSVAKIKIALKTSLNFYRCHQKHVECQSARIKKDKQAVQDLILCMDNFDADPFDESATEFPLLQSGVIPSSKVLKDLRNALEEEQKQSNDFLKTKTLKNCL